MNRGYTARAGMAQVWNLAFSALTGTLVLATSTSAFAALQFTSIYSFGGGANGWLPNSLVANSVGTLYGTTLLGGSTTGNGCNPNGCGTIFQVAFPGGKSSHLVMHKFSGGSGGSSPASLVLAKDGALYGTTASGGGCSFSVLGCGTVFRLARINGVWKHTVLYRFKGVADGNSPQGKLVTDTAGYIYGTTIYGGVNSKGSDSCKRNNFGCGTVFRFKPPPLTQNTAAVSIIFRFKGVADGANPLVGVTYDGGKLYGTTLAGGHLNRGTVFELTPPAGSAAVESEADPVQWLIKTLYSFLGGKDGYQPFEFAIDKAKNIFLTLLCTSGPSLVRLAPPSKPGDPHKFSVVYPRSGDPQLNHGNGINLLNFNRLVAKSMLVSMGGERVGSTPAKGSMLEFPLNDNGKATSRTVVHKFTGGADGAAPSRTIDVYKGSVHEIYGVTSSGGTGKAGTIFRIK